jgi:hypothetical protein
VFLPCLAVAAEVGEGRSLCNPPRALLVSAASSGGVRLSKSQLSLSLSSPWSLYACKYKEG